MPARSPFAPVALPIAALLAALVRWFVQGSGNLYTALDKRFYIADPDLGWRVSSAHPIWIGVDACAALAAVAIALAVTGVVIRRRESTHRRRAPRLRAIAWAVGTLSLVPALAAFATGSRPAGAVDALPVAPAGLLAGESIAAALDAPAGRYAVVAHDGTSITARLSAGKETFDARFTDVDGFWQGNPRDLTAPMTATFSVAAASIDTGVRGRNKHARGYLEADAHPRITVSLDRVLAARPDAQGIVFSARGTLTLMGRAHPIAITGRAMRADTQALERLHLTGTIVLVHASFSIAIHDTALATHAGAFDTDVIPISISLVLAL